MTSNRKMLQALLKNTGAMKVDTAENGLEAVQAAQANPLKYDIIFMDNLMPVMVRHRLPYIGFRITSLIQSLCVFVYLLPVRSGSGSQAEGRGLCEAGGGGDGQCAGR